MLSTLKCETLIFLESLKPPSQQREHLKYVFNCVYWGRGCKFLPVTTEAKKARYPGSGIAGSCESPVIGTRNQTTVLYKISMSS